MAVLEELNRLSDDRFLAIYEALSEQGFGPLDGELAGPGSGAASSGRPGCRRACRLDDLELFFEPPPVPRDRARRSDRSRGA